MCLAGAMPLCAGVGQVPSGNEAVLEQFIGAVNSSVAVFGYEYVIDDGRTEITGGGSVRMQGESYFLEDNGLEVYCDGTARWTVDRTAREVIIEAYDPENTDYAANPALLLRHFGELFSVSSSDILPSGDFHFTLKPAAASGAGPSAPTGIVSLEITLSSDAEHLSAASFKTKDGSTAAFMISSFSFYPISDPFSSFSFSFDTASLTPDYIVTDLR